MRVLEPFPLEGGRAGMGVVALRLENPSVRHAGKPSNGGAPTPIPGPFPIKGEGRRT